MRALCLHTDIRELPGSAFERLSPSIQLDNGFDDLERGACYDVVAVERRSDGLWIFLILPDVPTFPYPFPLELFQIVDSSLPSSWMARNRLDLQGEPARFELISFPEWAGQDDFYERLVDGSERETSIYKARLREVSQGQIPYPRLVPPP